MLRLFMAVALLLGAAATSPAPTASAHRSAAPNGYLLIDGVTVSSPVNLAEEGVAIYLRVRNAADSSVNAVIRYPTDGEVIKQRSARLSPLVQIPSEPGVSVEISVIAVPHTITLEGLNLIGFAIGELAGTAADVLIPGKKIWKLVGSFVIDRVTGATEEALEQGRVLGYYKSDTARLSGQTSIKANGFSATLSSGGTAPSAPVIPLPPSDITFEVSNTLGPNQIEERAKVFIDGHHKGTFTVSRRFREDVEPIEVKWAGLHSYVIEAEADFEEGGRIVTKKSVGSGIVNVVAGQRLRLVATSDYRVVGFEIVQAPTPVPLPTLAPPRPTAGNIRFVNNCSHALRLALSYQDLTGAWRYIKWWNIAPNSDTFLATANNLRLTTNNGYFYYYAVADRTGRIWSGSRWLDFDGQLLPTIEVLLPKDSVGNYVLAPPCV